MTRARTTVVIATRDRAGELCRTVDELLTLRPRPPVVVVDNASSDDTPVRMRNVTRRWPNVRLIRLSRNEGVAARNVGVRHAETPYVAFSDDDSWWAPGALPLAERLLDAHPRVGLLAARTLVGPEQREDPVCALMADSPLGRVDGEPGPAVLGFLACSAVLRRQAFLEAGGFSPLLHFGAEETLLAYDLAARGWALCYVDALVAHHHPSRRRIDPATRRALELRNNALITWMRRPVADGVAAAVRLVRDAVRDGWRDPAARRAATGAFRRLPHALARRRPLPAEVRRRAGVLAAARGGE
ncbi:glycosyltransferase family 2 protein [Gandjariella thermophila]|uniref:Glycosyl transferase n=1 Tax=Gandjariella thermophila TaxID=1931992 RepID=A0A4D4J974_9PSEU|nr:glycosyltransferase [Gandjariella thermophila]GDY33375.1 glycosyl transferase [Gandjariella thermophila]